jgi:hypothetical protein
MRLVLTNHAIVHQVGVSIKETSSKYLQAHDELDPAVMAEIQNVLVENFPEKGGGKPIQVDLPLCLPMAPRK